jgi:hypothetical protein
MGGRRGREQTEKKKIGIREYRKYELFFHIIVLNFSPL